MQYHGIASYKFEYKLSTDTNWTTGTTTNSSNGSCDYTIEGLTSGKSYNIQVTVTDRAGNSGMATTVARTSKHEKNPGGVITDITTSEDLIIPGWDSELITTNIGKTVNYTYTERKIDISGIDGIDNNTINAPKIVEWKILAEDEKYIFITARGASITLRGLKGYSNGVGILHTLCEEIYGHMGEPHPIQVRSLCLEDLAYSLKNSADRLRVAQLCEGVGGIVGPLLNEEDINKRILINNLEQATQ